MRTSVQFKEIMPGSTGASDYKQGAAKENRTMNQESEEWEEGFRSLFESKVTAYKNGERKVDVMFTKKEEDFLRLIGATPQEIFDFVEDWCDAGEPDPETALSITRIRRDYFLNDQQGQYSKYVKNTDLFPPREASLAGLEWFPRIIEKARAKLYGELPSDLMYGCGADRRFLKKVKVSPVEFLQVVREAGDDVESIVKFVTDRSQA